MRQYEIAKVAPTVQDAVPNLPQIKPEDLKRISDGAELAVKTYLNTFYRDDDPDHVVFDGFYLSSFGSKLLLFFDLLSSSSANLTIFSSLSLFNKQTDSSNFFYS